MTKIIMGVFALLIVLMSNANATRSPIASDTRIDVHATSQRNYFFVDPPSAQRYTQRKSSKRYAHRSAGKRVATRAKVARIASSLPSGVALIDKAKQYIGQTARQVGVRTTLWCSAFIRKITGASGVNDLARSWLSKPRTTARVGAIVVLSRGGRGSGHVGIVTGFKNGNPIVISGNHGHRVGVGVYPARRVLAYVTAT